MRTPRGWFAAFLMTCVVAAPSYGQTKGLRTISVRDADGRSVALYQQSYALVVGVGEYKAGWPRLPGVIAEVGAIEAALTNNGFVVQKVVDPNGDQLKKAYEDFVKKHGYDASNRLLFYFSGHGWSRKGGEHGYLVPTDAPDPRQDEKEFLRRSLSMNQILTWCKEMEAKHALFLFDSCFSGTIFKSRALPDIPPHITALTAKPVRQFITAGAAEEEVPAQSVFAKCFIRGLTGDADLSRDGYITGTELGMYLHDKVIYYHKGQTPQYGKMRDPDLDEGDFVFVASGFAQGSAAPGGVLVAPTQGVPTRQQQSVQIPDDLVLDLNDKVQMRMVWIRALNGWVAKYETTNLQFRQFRGTHDSGKAWQRTLNSDEQPVVLVSFEDATAFAQWVNKTCARQIPNGYRVRLPTGAEWSQLAQCGDGRKYPWGNAWPPDRGNYVDRTGKKAFVGWSGAGILDYDDSFVVSCPVESSGANDFGLFGVGGNVWELTDEKQDTKVALRGGSWGCEASSDYLACEKRVFVALTDRIDNYGFRLVMLK